MSSAIGEAFVRIRPDTRGFAAETKKGVGSALKTGAAVAGVGFGIAEIVKQLRQAVAVERERQLISLQAQTALRAAGKDWADYGDEIDRVIQKQSQLSSFDDEDLLQSFTLLFRATKDVNKALDLNGLAANVARGRNMDLVKTAQLLVRVQAGQVGSLRRLGIQIDKNATGEQALAAVQKQYAGAAKTFADSQLGAQARLNKVWNDTQEIVGQKLAPAIGDYQRRLAEWLNKANETGETQRVVNTYLGGAVDVLKGVVEGFKVARSVVAPFVEALGGVERTAKLLVLAFAVQKAVKFAGAVRGAAASFGFVAAASRTTTAKVVADAAVAGAALDTAYRPRTVPVTVVERIAPYTMTPGKTAPAPTKQPGRIGRLVKGVAGALGLTGAGAAIVRARRAGVLRFGANPFTFTAAALGSLILIGGGDQAQGQDDIEKAVNRYPYVADIINRLNAGGRITATEAAAMRPLAGKSLSTLSVSDLKALNDRLARAAQMGPKAPLPRRPDDRASRPTAAAVTDSGRSPQRRARLTGKQVEERLGAFEESITNAQIAGSVSRERTFLTREQKFIEEALRTASLSVVQRRSLKDKLLSVQQQIERIDADIAADAEAAQQQRDAARERRQAKVKAAAAKAAAAVRKTISEAQKLANTYAREGSATAYLNSSVALAERNAYKAVNDALKRAGAKIGGVTRKAVADASGGGGETVQDVFRQALDAWQQFGSNIGGPGALLSPQQVRGFVGGRIVTRMSEGMTDEQIRTRLMEAGVTESRRQTEILARIQAELAAQRTELANVHSYQSSGYVKVKTKKGVTDSVVYATDGNEYLYGRPG